MVNLRLLEYQVVDSKKIKLKFTEPVDNTVNIDNFTITSLSLGVPDAVAESVLVRSNTVYVKTSPLTPFAIYKLTLSSTESRPFKSVNGSILYEDGNTNAPLIQGPHNPDNFFFNRMVDYLKDNPYDTENPGLVRSYIEQVSDQLYKTYNTIRQAKTDNYLSITVVDEVHKRGKGPFDRLLNEGVYEIIRVGLTRTDTTETNTINLTAFPSEPVSLQQEIVTNELLFFGEKNSPQTFNETECTLKNSNIIKINRIFIQYSDGSSLLYDIDAFGYQIKFSRYDERSSSYILLENNQFKLSEKAILEGIKTPKPGDNITVDYTYKRLGRKIDPETIDLYTIKKSIREACPPLRLSFSLKGSNVCDVFGRTVSIGGITFLDPLSTPPFSSIHPAFAREVSFDETKLPTHAGEYAVDYENGKVYVYGIDSNENAGTGLFPPAATYYYKQKYSQDLDYSFDDTLGEIAANPLRSLIGKKTIITYDFEDTLVPEIDYKQQIHNEELAERAENRVVGNGIVHTLHSPITNVFRVYNETSGEVYGINRFNDNSVFFSYKNPPLFINLINERVRFEQISGHTLVKNDEFENSSSLTIFKFSLGTLIVSSTDDSLGSSINTSIQFTNTELFQKELYYNGEDDLTNIDNLLNVGEYVVNYNTGTIWLAVLGTQTDDVGAISYRSKKIITNYPHIINVTQIYSLINEESEKTKYTLNSFDDTTVDLLTYPTSNNEGTVLATDTIELTEEASAIRHLYDKSAIINNINSPIDFASQASVSFSTVTIVPIEVTWNLNIEPDGTTIVASDIIYTDSQVVLNSIVSIKKQSNGQEIYNTTLSDGSFTANTITLPSDTTGIAGESVFVRVKVFINNNADVILDYNRGEMFIDYIYCNDEIIISYEYGDNSLDFRETSLAVPEDTIYYVSYKYGALRDALFANFGTLIDLEILHNFNVDLDRERYRDALMACLQTFPKGPQVQAISNIAKLISHVEPEIWESFNDEWILGQGHLYNNEATLSGSLDIIPGKFGYAVDISDSEDSIIIPFSSHVKLEQGTLEMFVIPNWDGIDNDAEITFEIKRDGYYISADNIWIGASSYHPELDYLYNFTLKKEQINFGVPVNIASSDPLKWGAYIYYDVDDIKWKVLFKDENGTHTYHTIITTNGEFYNVKPLLDILNPEDSITTLSTTVEAYMTISSTEYDGYSIDGYAAPPFSFDGLSFMSDKEHYFFDYISDPSKPNENRISLLKDGRGYLTFKVYAKKDVNNKAHIYQVSKDISDWNNGDTHFIGTSWRIATKDKRDEIHLFIDGEEVPNILRYGGRPVASATDRFRTVVPEILSDPVPNNTLSNIDMVITGGSDILFSDTSDFGIAGILVGSLLYIDNPIILGPEVDGYFTITEIVTGNSIRVDHTFTFDMTDVGFTINPWTVPVTTNIMYESNIAVSILEFGGNEIELPGLRAENPSYSVEVDTDGQPYLTLRGNAKAGDVLAIRTLGLNHRRVRDRIYNWGTISHRINTFLPPPINLDHVKILPVILPRTIVDGYVVSPAMQPSSSLGGRTLEVIIGNTSNCDFTSNPIEITINGTTFSGAVSETITAIKSGIYETTEQFETISDIDCSADVFDPLLDWFSLEVREKNSITVQENDGYFAILRYSYKESTLNALDGYSASSTITSSTAVFDDSHLGFALSVTSPIIETYTITEVVDSKTVIVNNSLVDFSNGTADLYNVSIARSGYNNGLFTLELAGSAGIPYYLLQGYYDLDYATYLDIPFEIKELNCALGSNQYSEKQANCIIEELRSLDVSSTDTRVGEILEEGARSITTDSNVVKQFTPDERTILLMHFDEKPFVDSSIPYKINSSEYLQADEGVNSNFQDALYINEEPLIIDNTNIFFNNEGTIEFWVSPKFDTANDPVRRTYFDATASYVETVTSLTNRDLILHRAAKYIISITVNGYPEVNYADGCVISADAKTIRLGKSLPNNNMELTVIYIPFRGSGDRVSIYKSQANSINFDIVANKKLSSLSTPVFWPRDTWHRITASWRCNTKTKQDEMRLFVDGVEKNKIVFGLGLNFGTIYTFNQLMNSSSPIIKTTINLRESFNKLFIGGNSFGGEVAHARIDNLKISRKMKQMITVGTQKLDNDYSSDISSALPVIEDIYTTYLMDFDKEEEKIEDFTILKNQVSGIFDFDLKVIDSFDIIRDNPRSEEILENLIKKLKPAVSRAFIKYIR